MRILDPDGDGVLTVPEEHASSLNGPVEQFNELAGIPTKTPDGRDDTRPGFHIPPQRSEWFSRVLARASAAGLLTFVGDRATARELLTPRQHQRVGSKYTVPGTDARFDTGIMLGDLPFVGTDHIFRFGSQRMEAFSGMLVGLHQLLAAKDLQGFQAALPEVLAEWSTWTPTARYSASDRSTQSTNPFSTPSPDKGTSLGTRLGRRTVSALDPTITMLRPRRSRRHGLPHEQLGRVFLRCRRPRAASDAVSPRRSADPCPASAADSAASPRRSDHR
jgi:hypothetical protein